MHSKPRALIALLVVGALASGCVGRTTTDRLDAAETQISILQDEMAALSTTTTTIAPTTTTTEADLLFKGVADIAAKVSPAVVQIETRDAVGSGVIYTPDGLVLTAAHVVEGFPEVTIRLNDGRTTQGTVLGTHHLTDVAVVQIEGDFTDLPTAEFALGEELQTGQLAVAVGSPFGFSRSVSAGIVSTTARIIDTVVMVQTDAAINPGNSGGPLVDADGRVIGISDIIFTDSGESAGVGFAISIDLAALVADQLVAGDVVQLAYLGVLAVARDDGEAGAQIQDVTAGSGADDAGIQVGDVITAVDGRPVYDPDGLRALVLVRHPGDEIVLTVVRDGEEMEITATLGSTSG